MYYSAIGLLAAVVLLIENRDILLLRYGVFDTPAWRAYRWFLVAVLVAAVLGAYIAKAFLRKPLTKYGMLNGASPVEAPKEA